MQTQEEKMLEISQKAMMRDELQKAGGAEAIIAKAVKERDDYKKMYEHLAAQVGLYADQFGSDLEGRFQFMLDNFVIDLVQLRGIKNIGMDQDKMIEFKQYFVGGINLAIKKWNER